MLRLVAEWLMTEWQNPSWDWLATHTKHTHTESIECPSRREDAASGPGASAGIQRAAKVSPQFQIQPTVNYRHGKTQPSASTPSAAFNPNSSTSLCAWDFLDPNPAPQLLNKSKRKLQQQKQGNTERMDTSDEKPQSPGQNEWVADILLATLGCLVLQNSAGKISKNPLHLLPHSSFIYLYYNNSQRPFLYITWTTVISPWLQQPQKC